MSQKLGFLLIFSLVLLSKAQIDVDPEDHRSNEPHYIDGKHNPHHEHSEAELQEHREIFESYDLNQDGYIDPQEIRESLEGVTDAEMTELFDFADRDHDGALNFEEYLINAFDYVEPETERTSPESQKQEI